MLKYPVSNIKKKFDIKKNEEIKDFEKLIKKSGYNKTELKIIVIKYIKKRAGKILLILLS